MIFLKEGCRKKNACPQLVERFRITPKVMQGSIGFEGYFCKEFPRTFISCQIGGLGG